MIYGSICFLHAFLFYVLEVNNHANGHLVRTIPFVFVVLQFFAHPLLFVDFCGQAKLNRKAAAEFEQKQHEETAE